MISKHKIKNKNGTYKTNVRIVEGYRPGPGKAPKQRQIKNLGYAEDYEDQEAFWKMVEEEERKFKESKENIEVQLDSSLTLKDTRRYELGYKYLDAVYDFLEIDKFLETKKLKLIMITKKYSDTSLQKEFCMQILFVHVFKNQRADMGMNVNFSIIK